MTLSRFLLVLLVGTSSVLGAVSPNAYNSEVPPAPDGERFLFVVETTSSMADQQAANEATIYDLIRSGINGYIKTGDTYGLWTFNNETRAGEFPMRVWEAKKALQQATIAAAFLNELEYEKSANIKNVTDKLSKVIQAVSNLTVFVISDGSSSALGTPFDKTIQADYRKLRSVRRQAKRPFVTTLIVRDGWFVEAKVNVGGTPITMPRRIEPVLAKAPPAPAPTNAPPAPKRPPGAVLAFRDLAVTNDAVTATATSSIAAVKAESPPPPRPKVIQIITKSNPPPNNITAAVPAPEPAPAAPAIPITAQTASRPPTNASAPGAAAPLAPSPTSVTVPSTALVSSAPSPVAAPAPIAKASAIPVPAPAPLAPPAVQVAPPPPPVTAAAPKTPITVNLAPPPASGASPTFLASTNQILAAVTPPPAAPAAAPVLISSLLSAPAPIPVAAREVNSAAAATIAPTAAPASKLPAIEAVVGTPSQAGVSWMLVYGAVLLAAAGLLVLVVVRRGRSPHASIITQSMERR